MRRFTILLLSVICLVFLPSYVIKRGPSGVDGEKVLQQLYDLKYFAAVPNENFRNHYWFSSYSGSDSNPCTEDQPCQTLGFAKDVCLEYTRCTFKAGEVWSPLVLTMAENYGYQVGEGVDWNAGADVGVVIGVDPENKIIVVREVSGAGTDPEAADEVITIDNRITGTVSGVTDTLGTGWEDRIDMDCTAGELCELWEGESYENPPIFDCNEAREAAGANLGIFSWGNVGDLGVAALQNVVVQYCPGDAFIQQNDVDTVFLNANCNNEHNTAGTAYNCLTSHVTGDVIYINGSMSGQQNGASGSPIALTSSGNHTLISQGHFLSQGNLNGTATVLSQDAGSTTIVGPYMQVVAAAAESERTITLSSSGAAETINLTTCRTTIKGGSNTATSDAISTVIAASSAMNIKLFDTTMVDGSRGISWSSDNGTFSLFARGLLVYTFSVASIRDTSTDVTTGVTVDVEGVYEDGTFVVEGGAATNKAGVDAGDASGWTFFDTNSYASDGANEPWDNTAGTLAMPQYSIHPECGGATAPTSCYDVSIGPYNCQLSAPIPSFVTGNAISNLVLQGKIGAR